jgi:hypothetical protein
MTRKQPQSKFCAQHLQCLHSQQKCIKKRVYVLNIEYASRNPLPLSSNLLTDCSNCVCTIHHTFDHNFASQLPKPSHQILCCQSRGVIIPVPPSPPLPTLVSAAAKSRLPFSLQEADEANICLMELGGHHLTLHAKMDGKH